MSKHSSFNVRVHSDRLDIDFLVHVQDETQDHPICNVLTVHELGGDHTSFRDWIACPEMKGLRERIKWIHVDLPGQEVKAKEIMCQYPTIDEMSEELIIILDELKINQVIGLGEGCGANIIARFGMIHPNRCLGVALIHPTGNTATFMQNLREKFLTNMLPSSTHDSYLVWHKFGHPDPSNEKLKERIKEFQENLVNKRNPKNLSSLIESYLNRSNIVEKIDELKCDVLIAFGKRASFEHETQAFYQALSESRKDDLKRMVNCPLLELDNVSAILDEAPDKLAVSFQYFLQGIGVIPAMPLSIAVEYSARSRTLSMEEADQPRRNSLATNK